MGRLIPLLDHLRSYLGMVALLAIGLPAVVLVLTLLADNGRRLPEPISDGVKGGEVAHHQARPNIDGRGGNGTGSVRPFGRHGETESPEGSSEADGASPTRQPLRDQKVADREQDLPSATAEAPATSTATAAAPTPTTEPTPVGPSTPPVVMATAPATAPATTSAPATAEAAPASPEAAPASTSESSAPTVDAPVPTPDEVPVEGARGVDFGEHHYDPFE